MVLRRGPQDRHRSSSGRPTPTATASAHTGTTARSPCRPPSSRPSRPSARAAGSAPWPAPTGGGMGMPETVGTAVNEFFAGANVALSLTIMLTRGAAALIEHFGTDDQKTAVPGEDVRGRVDRHHVPDRAAGRLRRRRLQDPGGQARRRHLPHHRREDLHHLRRSRPDRQHRPPGPRPHPGRAPRHEGACRCSSSPRCGSTRTARWPRRTTSTATNIEEKMGIHGSPTCVLVFGGKDGCRGLLLGEEQQGMKIMFHLMNDARIEVGLQGCAAAGAAHQHALDVREEAHAEPPLDPDEEPRGAPGADHRAPRRAPHAAHVQGLHRGHARPALHHLLLPRHEPRDRGRGVTSATTATSRS